MNRQIFTLFFLIFPLASSAIEKKSGIFLQDKSCTEECICIADEKAFMKAKLNENGPVLAELKSGTNCLVADFTGDSIKDFVIPGSEGKATVIVNSKSGDFTAFPINAGGMIEIYDSTMSNRVKNPPKISYSGIFVEWVGQKHAIFLWDGKAFKRELFEPSSVKQEIKHQIVEPSA